jgi:hypothetical protein
MGTRLLVFVLVLQVSTKVWQLCENDATEMAEVRLFRHCVSVLLNAG